MHYKNNNYNKKMHLLSESDRERRKELRRIIDAWGTPRAYDKESTIEAQKQYIQLQMKSSGRL